MKLNVKKLACVMLSLSMIASVTACKKSGKKEAEGCIAATETILNTITALNSKKMKNLQKSYGVDSEDIDYLKSLSGNDMVKTVMGKAIVEVDEDSADEKKGSATCDAVVKLPNYEDAYDEADGDPDSFEEEINKQKEKKYQEVNLTLEFDVDEDEYTWTNASDVLEDLFGDMVEVLEFDPSLPVDTEVDDTTVRTRTTPPTTSAQDAAPLRDVTAKKVDLSEDVIASALNEADPEAAQTLNFFDSDTDLSGFKLTRLGMAYSHSYNVNFSIYVFENADSAKQYFEQTTGYMEKYAVSFQSEGDWGYMSYQVGTLTFGVYYSGNIYISMSIYDGAPEYVDIIPSFVEALCK